MNIAGSTTQINAMSPEQMHGLRRTKPLNTTLPPAGTSNLRHGAPVVTNLSAGKPPLQTHLTQRDLDGHAEHKSNVSQHDRLVKQTQKWVAQAFYGPMLKQMRESPFHSDLFDGGRGGKAFGAMYDQELAQRMSRGAGSKLVNSIVNHIEARSSQVQQQMQFKLQQQMRQAQANQAQKQVQTVMPVEAR